MNYQQVFQRFIELANIDFEQAEKYKWLCTNSIEELQEMLADDVDETACCGRLSATAAAMAFYNYVEICKESNITSFKAGDITVEYSERKKFADEYLKQCMKGISKYLKDNSFFFRGVDI